MDTNRRPNTSVPGFDMSRQYQLLMTDLGYSRGEIWYIVKRIRNEGVKFVTVVLPALAKHTLKCVELGHWVPFDFTGVSPMKSVGRERYTRVFRDDLVVLFSLDSAKEDRALALLRLRQVCEYAYKLALPFDDNLLESAESAFIADDESISYDSDFADEMRIVAECFLPETKKLTLDSITGSMRNGPGSFSGSDGHTPVIFQKDGLDGTVPTRFRSISGGFRSRKSKLSTGQRFHLKHGSSCRDISEVLFVPKDSRGPRVIMREPYHTLRVQMGFHDVVKRTLEYDTRGRIQFTSQAHFQELARYASKDRSYATIDLSKASDLVSYTLASRVFWNFPLHRKCFADFRISTTALPSGNRVRLRKLAGMGSGYTFPVMASLIYCAILASLPKPWRRDYSQRIWVYGDDIIFPTEIASYALKGLEKAGCRVNERKSYIRSNFRESCGGDFYYGHDVSPVRLKLDFLKLKTKGTIVSVVRRQNQPMLIKLEAHCRELIKAGLHRAAGYLYRKIEGFLGPLPLGSGFTPVLCRYAITGVFNPDDNTYSCWHKKPVTSPTGTNGIDRKFSEKLRTMEKDLCGVFSSLPWGYDAHRYENKLVAGITTGTILNS